MAKKSPRWVGPKEARMDPNFPQYFTRGETEGYTLAYNGAYKTLMLGKPAKGSVIARFPGYYVSDVTVKPTGAGEDGPGMMTVTVESVVAGGTASPADETKVSIESGRLEKSIYSNPYYNELGDEYKAEVRKAIDAGETTPPPIEAVGDKPTKAAKLFYKLVKGETHYVETSPVVTVTTFSYTQPEAGRTGRGTRTTAKPHPAAPAGYVWLKTVDDINQDGARGKWQRVQKWEAADDWDVDHYTIPPP